MTTLATALVAIDGGGGADGELGELLPADGSLIARALELAEAQDSPNTQRAYAGSYRRFLAWLEGSYGEASTATFTLAAITRYRDHLRALGRSPATIARELSALRRLAAQLSLDPRVQLVRARTGQRDVSPALTGEEYQRLLAAPDKRTRAGKRDTVLLYLLGDAGLRVSEAVALTVDDFKETRRQADTRKRAAVAPRPADRTHFELVVLFGKRGRTRRVPLTRAALAAILEWHKVRPTCASNALLLSLPRTTTRDPASLSVRGAHKIVTGHARSAALPPGHHHPHALRHTFCTMLAERGVAIEVIKELAGHADIRTTDRYTHVSDNRRKNAITELDHGRSDLERAANRHGAPE
jgi:integrase/recombinase XerC